MPDPTKKRSPLVIATSMTEKLEVNNSTVDTKSCCVKLSGHVTWTGRSTMEVPMTVSLVNIKDGWRESPMMKSVFIYSARDHKDESAACVHPLVATNDEEDARIQEGARKHQQRKLISSEPHWKFPPNVEEMKEICNLFLESMDPEALSMTVRKLPPGCEWMERTKHTVAVPTPPDVFNMHGIVFGGYVMRTAAEVAFAAGATFSKAPVRISHVSDIQFMTAISMESILIFTTEVAYSEGDKMHNRVQTDVADSKKVKFTSNTSHWIASSPHELPRVMPKTYGEYMLYLDARRRFREVMGLNF